MAFVLTAGTSASNARYFDFSRLNNETTASNSGPIALLPTKGKESKEDAGKRIMNLVDPAHELIDPTPNVHELFVLFTDQLFFGALGACTVEWSARMTSCAGICSYHPKSGMCVIRLSEPLLKLRPRKDLIETLLHEMIHAYLFVTQRDQDRDGHGPSFQEQMYRINAKTGTNITIYHSFHAEVALYKQHWWRCQGACRDKVPYFGWVKRAMNRAPGPNDVWWAEHSANCGGSFVKVKEPEPAKKTKKKTDMKPANISSKERSWLTSLPMANTSGMTLGEALNKEFGQASKKSLPTKSSTSVKRKAIDANNVPKENVAPEASSSKQLKMDSLFPGKGYMLGGRKKEANTGLLQTASTNRIRVEEITIVGETHPIVLDGAKKEEIICLGDVCTTKLTIGNRSIDVICLD